MVLYHLTSTHKENYEDEIAKINQANWEREEQRKRERHLRNDNRKNSDAQPPTLSLDRTSLENIDSIDQLINKYNESQQDE